ncbi:MAG: LapA family protein [Bacillota bacterium]
MLIILVSTAVGALVVVLLGFSWQFRRYLYVRRLEGEAEGLKKELGKARQALAAAQAGGPAEKAEAQEKHVQVNNKPGDEKKTGDEK